MNRNSRKVVRDVLTALAVVAVGAFLITRFVAVPWTVNGESMTPTLMPGDRVIVDLWSYRRRAPHPGDVALLAGPRGVPIVKRVSQDSETPPVNPLVPASAGEISYFVVGDNPRSSVDSRDFGAVPRSRFTGRVVWCYWPPSRAGRVR